MAGQTNAPMPVVLGQPPNSPAFPAASAHQHQRAGPVARTAASAITASSPDEKDSFFDPAGDKVYRHPTFYQVPEGVEHL